MSFAHSSGNSDDGSEGSTSTSSLSLIVNVSRDDQTEIPRWINQQDTAPCGPLDVQKGTLNVPPELLSYLKEMCKPDPPQPITLRAPENTQRPHGPPKSTYHQASIDSLQGKDTVPAEFCMNWVKGVWKVIDEIKFELYEEKVKVYELQHSTGSDENDMLRRKLNMAEKTINELEAENKILKAEVIIANHKATTVEQAHLINEARYAAMRDTQEQKEARLDSLLRNEDAKRDLIHERLDSDVIKALSNVADELRGDGALKREDRTRITGCIKKIQCALEDLNDSDLWKVLAYGNVTVPSTAASMLEDALKKEITAQMERDRAAEDPRVAVHTAYVQGLREGTLKRDTTRLSPRDPMAEIGKNQFVFTAADLHDQVEQEVNTRFWNKDTHTENQEDQICMAIHACMKATAGLSRDPTTNLDASAPNLQPYRFPALADRVADFVFTHEKHLRRNSFWSDFDQPCGDNNYLHPLGVVEVEGGYFHRLSGRVDHVRRGDPNGDYDVEQKNGYRSFLQMPAIETVDKW